MCASLGIASPLSMILLRTFILGSQVRALEVLPLLFLLLVALACCQRMGWEESEEVCGSIPAALSSSGWVLQLQTQLPMVSWVEGCGYPLL